MKRHCSCLSGLFLVIVFQMIIIVMRLVFDLLGMQYAAISANMCQVLGLIIGTFGAWRLKKPLLAVYSAWTFLWIVWNVFLVCLYLEVGKLRLDQHSWTVNLLSANDDTSWLKQHPFACARDRVNVVVVTAPGDDGGTGVSNEAALEFCWSEYQYLEVYLSTFQLVLAVFGLSFALCTIKEIIFHQEDSSVLSMEYVNSLDRRGKLIHGIPPPGVEESHQLVPQTPTERYHIV